MLSCQMSLHPIQQINFEPLPTATRNEYGPLSFLSPQSFFKLFFREAFQRPYSREVLRASSVGKDLC